MNCTSRPSFRRVGRTSAVVRRAGHRRTPSSGRSRAAVSRSTSTFSMSGATCSRDSGATGAEESPRSAIERITPTLPLSTYPVHIILMNNTTARNTRVVHHVATNVICIYSPYLSHMHSIMNRRSVPALRRRWEDGIVRQCPTRSGRGYFSGDETLGFVCDDRCGWPETSTRK